MVKARLGRHIGANDVILLGLSDENLQRLRAGDSIYFQGSAVGLTGVDFAIVHGRTELEIAENFGLLPGTKND